MRYTFEVYISGDTVTKEDWDKFYKALNAYGGFIGSFKLCFTVRDNVVHFYISSDKDLGAIANNLSGLIMRPVEFDDIGIPSDSEVAGKDRFLQLVPGGTLLDFKEKYHVKKSKDMEVVVMDIKAVTETKALIGADFYFKNAAGQYTRATKIFAAFPSHLLAIDFSGDNTRYLKKKVDKYLDIEKSLHLLSSDKEGALFKVDGFPYLQGEYYININNYEFEKHSFIVGASGSGKSKLIGLLVDRIANSPRKDQYRVVVIDPHNALKDDFYHIKDSEIVGFGAEGVELFSDAASDVQAETELTTMLFKSLMPDQFNPRLERVLRFSLFVLFTSKSMSLDQLKRFLIELELRQQVLDHVKGYVPDNIVRFFGADFSEIKTQHYNDAILPIVQLVDEMQLQPSLAAGGGQGSLGNIIKNNFLSVFSLNKVSMGEKVVKTVAGLIIQQIFMLAQAREFGQRVIMIIDEVSVVQNPALSQILSEARKFNLSVILTQQYFGQIEKDLQDAIFTNVYNYYTFSVSEEDARTLEGNLSIELPKAVIEAEEGRRLKEADLRVKILTELSPRECLVRLSANGQIHPCIKARTVDANYALEAPKIAPSELKKVEKVDTPAKFVEKEEQELKSLDTPSNPAPMPPSPVMPPPTAENMQPDVIHQTDQVPSYEQLPEEEMDNMWGGSGGGAGFEKEPSFNPETAPEDVSEDTQTALNQDYIDQPAQPNLGPPSKSNVNIGDILASQSSSRYMVNNNKEQQQ